MQWCQPSETADPQKQDLGLVFRDSVSGWFLLVSLLHSRATTVTVGPWSSPTSGPGF